MKKLFVFLLTGFWITMAFGQETIKLPKPVKEGGKSLMETLSLRSSSRNFSDKELESQKLSNMLWAAWGVNRPESGKRTAPSAHNKQEMDLYIALSKGLYLYKAEDHTLLRVVEKDIRKFTGKQDFVGKAALNLIYVADLSRLEVKNAEKALPGDYTVSYAHAGFISQNVYLFCASENLVTVVRAWIDYELLAREMQLKPTQRIILAQTVGYPQ